MRGKYPVGTSLLMGLLMVGSMLVAVAPTATANHDRSRSYDVQPFAGSFGAGDATNLAMSPEAMAVHGDIVYFADTHYYVIRKLDMSTGRSEVVVGDETVDPEAPCVGTPPAGRGDRTWVCRPSELAVDPVSGDLYFIDEIYDTVRKVEAIRGTVSSDSFVTRFAGGGGLPFGAGVAAEGRRATEVELVEPEGLTVDRQGRVFISEPSMDRVRMVETDGQIWTVAGMRQVAKEGLARHGVDPAGCVQPAPLGNIPPSRICVPGAVGLDLPAGLALGPDGNVLVADANNERIVRLVEEPLPVAAADAPDGVWSVAELELDGPVSPWNLASTASGDIFVQQRWNDDVLRVSGSRVTEAYKVPEDDEWHLVSIAARGETLLTSEYARVWNDGWRVTFDGIYAVGEDGGRARLAGNDLRRYGGDGGAAPEAQMHETTDIVYDSFGSFYLVDHQNDVLRKVDCNGVIHRDYEIGRNLPSWGPPERPQVPITADQHGNIFLRDYDEAAEQFRLVRLSPWGEVTTMAQPWPGTEMIADQPDLYQDEADIAVGGMMIDEVGRIWFTARHRLYHRSSRGHQVLRFDPSGPADKQYDVIAGNGSRGFRGDNGPAKLAELDDPRGLAMDDEGNLFIADTSNHRIRRWDAHSREITTVVGTSFNEMLDRLGQADTSHLGGQRGEDVFLRFPADVAYDSKTNELWVLDSDNGRVLQAHRNRMTDAAGETTGFTVSVSAGQNGEYVRAAIPIAGLQDRGPFDGAQGIALGDPGSVLVADTERDRAVAVTTGDAPVGACKEPPVEVKETAITLTVPSQGQHTDAVEATARLLDEDGAAVAGQPVGFTLGTESATVETDATGLAVATLPLTDEAGPHRVSASFAGSRAYAGSIAEAGFEILKEATVATYVGDTSAGEDRVRLAATLLDDDDSPVAGKEMSFAVAGQTFTAVTDASGLAEVVAELSKHKKSEEVMVGFAEDEGFLGGSTVATITWTKAKGG